MELHIVSAEELDKHKNIMTPYIESFVERAKGRFSLEDVFNRIKEGNWTLWVVHEDFNLKAVLITQMILYPKIKELQIIMCVGDEYKNWYHLVSKMKEYAKLIGCKKLTAITRPGWEKIMTDFNKTHVYLEIDL